MKIEKRKNDIDFIPGETYKKHQLYDADDYFESPTGTIVLNRGWVCKFKHISWIKRLCYYRCKLDTATKEVYRDAYKI